MEKTETIPVTIEKSHIVTIGERLYSEAVELVRELVNNAYDADATEVRVDVIQTGAVCQTLGICQL